jgi:hypothetical protein
MLWLWALPVLLGYEMNGAKYINTIGLDGPAPVQQYIFLLLAAELEENPAEIFLRRVLTVCSETSEARRIIYRAGT